MHRVGYPWPRVPFPLTRRACVNPDPRVSPSSWPLFPAHEPHVPVSSQSQKCFLSAHVGFVSSYIPRTHAWNSSFRLGAHLSELQGQKGTGSTGATPAPARKAKAKSSGGEGGIGSKQKSSSQQQQQHHQGGGQDGGRGAGSIEKRKVRLCVRGSVVFRRFLLRRTSCRIARRGTSMVASKARGG